MNSPIQCKRKEMRKLVNDDICGDICKFRLKTCVPCKRKINNVFNALQTCSPLLLKSDKIPIKDTAVMYNYCCLILVTLNH